MTAPEERAALAAHREACGVCGHDGLCWQALEMIEATHARRLEELRESLEPGTPERIFVGLMDECEKRGIGSRYSARHVVMQVMQHIDQQERRLEEARAQVEAIKSLTANRIVRAAVDYAVARLSPPPPRGEA